jgi:heme o synthase
VVLTHFYTLIKPKIISMSLIAATCGMLLGGGLGFSGACLALLGIGFTVASACSLNMVIEAKTDALMKRTRLRPVASGELGRLSASLFGCSCGLLGLFILWKINPLTAGLGFLSLCLYTLVYTPMKKHSPWAWLVGTIPGAMPPLMGWTATGQEPAGSGLALFFLIITWQIPHVLAIFIYLEDEYQQAGILNPIHIFSRRKLIQLMTLFTMLLFPMSLIPFLLGEAGLLYAVFAPILGLCMAAQVLQGFWLKSLELWAMRVKRGSLVYMSLLLTSILADGVLG